MAALTIAGGAVVGAASYAINALATQSEWNWNDFGTAAAVGAVGGALLVGGGALIGAAAFATASTATTLTIGGFAVAGAGSGVIAGEIGYSAGALFAQSNYDSGNMLISSGVAGLAGGLSGGLTGPTTAIGSSVFGAMATNAAINGVAGVSQYSFSQYNNGQQPTLNELSVAFLGSVATSVTTDVAVDLKIHSNGRDPYSLLGAGGDRGSATGQQELRIAGYLQASRSAKEIGVTQAVRSGMISPIANWWAQVAVGR